MRAIVTKLREHSNLIEQMLNRDKEKEALQVYLDCLRTSISAAKNQLVEEKEQIKQLEVD